ncbi:MAG: prepilin-type N-terminal cleavage/methylation domain-containing protein, partial [Chitinivibrionia bacterium]|nr:prepilin-type N-terminal cleavage/methylation domain-containing protein [Chitinivibrionia bacterium]
MNKKGFTLVELMVVIVIIGVLAAVAIPKMMAATNKAKAGEGPQILSAISRMEASHKAEN